MKSLMKLFITIGYPLLTVHICLSDLQSLQLQLLISVECFAHHLYAYDDYLFEIILEVNR